MAGFASLYPPYRRGHYFKMDGVLLYCLVFSKVTGRVSVLFCHVKSRFTTSTLYGPHTMRSCKVSSVSVMSFTDWGLGWDCLSENIAVTMSAALRLSVRSASWYPRCSLIPTPGPFPA